MMVLMPPFCTGDQSFLNQWQGLVGRGSHGYAGVMTVIGNPVFTLTSLLEPEKFLYLVQLPAPLCFFPWRRPIGYLMTIPGFFFTLLETGYLPLVQNFVPVHGALDRLSVRGAGLELGVDPSTQVSR